MSNTRLVVLILGVVALVSLAGIILLAYSDKSTPDVLVATVSTAIGAIGAVLVNNRGTEPPGPPPGNG